MDKRSIKRIINYLENRLTEDGVKISQIILFGSQAKKNARRESDMDLIVVSESFRRKGILKRADMASDAIADTITHFHVPIDVLLETPEEVNQEYLKQIGAVVFAA